MASSSLRIGVLGAAKIVPSALINPAKKLPDVKVIVIAARDSKRAASFARRYSIPNVHQTYTDLLSDPEVDAIYNPLPNGLHAEWTIKALRAGKHVLCEKPFASNSKEASEMANTAKETGKMLSEAFAYRTHPMAARLKEIMTNGEIGNIKSIEARFGFLLPELSNIRFNYDLGGGALMDAGCYPVSLVRFLVGLEPTVIEAKAKLIKPQVDSKVEAKFTFPNGIQASIVCNMLSPRLFESFLKIQGDAGEVRVINPYHPHWFNFYSIRNAKGTQRGTIRGENAYTSQLRAFADAIKNGTPLTTNPDDALNNMRVIDAIYKKAGLQIRGV